MVNWGNINERNPKMQEIQFTEEIATTTDFEEIVNLLISAIGHNSKVTREDSGYYCDRGNYGSETQSDTTDLLTTLLIYRVPSEDYDMRIEYKANQFDQINTDYEYIVTLTSNDRLGWSSSRWTVAND